MRIIFSVLVAAGLILFMPLMPHAVSVAPAEQQYIPVSLSVPGTSGLPCSITIRQFLVTSPVAVGYQIVPMNRVGVAPTMRVYSGPFGGVQYSHGQIVGVAGDVIAADGHYYMLPSSIARFGLPVYLKAADGQ